MGRKQRLIILGAGGQGRVVADMALHMGIYREIGFLDDDPERMEAGLPYPLLGRFPDYSKWVGEADFIVGIGDRFTREAVQEQLTAAGATMATLIHPRAFVASRVTIGEGSVVMAGAVISVDATVGRGVIVNTCASVDHDCRIGDFCHVSVGAHLGGTVHVGYRSVIGIGAAVRNNIDICADCVVGAGAAVVCSLTEPGVYVGVPARLRHPDGADEPGGTAGL